MPELPDIVVYLEALEQRIQDHVLEQAEIRGPFLLRTVDPPIESIQGKKITELRRVGKRIALGFENHLWLVFHLMIAGRLHWSRRRVTPDGRRTLAALHFDSGTLTLTEAGTRKRASLHLVAGEAGLAKLDPGGIDVFAASLEQFRAALTATNHTLKRALTDPHIFSGIGNAYSDEILHEAELLPLRKRTTLKPDELSRLYAATRKVLSSAIESIKAQPGYEPHKQDRSFMAVHGKAKEKCPRCGHRISELTARGEATDFCRGCQH